MLIETLTKENLEQALNFWWSGNFKVMSFHALEAQTQTEENAFIVLLAQTVNGEVSEDWEIQLIPEAQIIQGQKLFPKLI